MTQVQSTGGGANERIAQRLESSLKMPKRKANQGHAPHAILD